MSIDALHADAIHSDETTLDSSYDKLWHIIKGCRFGMLTTLEDGMLRSRPMTTVQKEFGGTIWFFVPTDSDAAHAIARNEQVCVAYANVDKADFVSLSGTASIITHTGIKEKFWSAMVQAWFPQGAASDDVSMIKMDVSCADYWDSVSNKFVQHYSMASAYVRGSTPKHIGEHRSLKM